MQQRFKSQFAEFSVCIIWASRWFLGITGITLLMKKKKKWLCKSKWRRENSNMGSQVIRSLFHSLFPSKKKKKKSWRRLTDSHESGPNCCPGPLRATYISSSPNGQPSFPTGRVSMLPWLVQSFYHFFAKGFWLGAGDRGQGYGLQAGLPLLRAALPRNWPRDPKQVNTYSFCVLSHKIRMMIKDSTS